MERVFISYSQDSSKLKESVLKLSNTLRANGIDCEIDQYTISPKEGWPKWMIAQIDKSHKVIIVCSKGYYEKTSGKVSGGKGVKFEITLALQDLYENPFSNNKFIPVIFQEDDMNYVPEPLRAFTVLKVSSELEKLLCWIKDIPYIKKPPVQDQCGANFSKSSSRQNEINIVEETKIKTLSSADGAEPESLLVDEHEITKIKDEFVSEGWPIISLNKRQLCDLELILNGGFSPLRGFMNQTDAIEVMSSEMRLTDGTLWPLPILLDIDHIKADAIDVGRNVLLVDDQGTVLAAMLVEDKWVLKPNDHVSSIFGIDSNMHQGVRLFKEYGSVCLGGNVRGLTLPPRYGYSTYHSTPAQARKTFQDDGWERIIGFQTRNYPHRGHLESMIQAHRQVGGGLLCHPVFETNAFGKDHGRLETYEELLKEMPGYIPRRLLVLPYSMRLAGPREALLHAIIRRNYGCTDFIVGRDHAGPPHSSVVGKFYSQTDSQELCCRFKEELGINIVIGKEMVFDVATQKVVPKGSTTPGGDVKNLSGTTLRQYLCKPEEIPPYLVTPGVKRAIKHSHPPVRRKGVTVLFTGLPGSGKSTTAATLSEILHSLEPEHRRVITILDGDEARQNLSKELGFSRDDRHTHVVRLGYVAREITRHGGVTLLAPIAPHELARQAVRNLVEEVGDFVLVFVKTPLDVCMNRDPKAKYRAAKARKPVDPTKGFTGVHAGPHASYEAPNKAHLEIDTTILDRHTCAQKIFDYLKKEGYFD